MWWLNEPKTMSFRPSPVTSPIPAALAPAAAYCADDRVAGGVPSPVGVPLIH